MLRQGGVDILRPLEIQQDPELVAQAAGLRYVSDSLAGFSRRRRGSGFIYLDPQGHPLKSENHLRRIRSLALPPAWTSVWICPSENGHLQATGRDVKGRKQYRYHPQWNRVRNETKFTKMLVFAEKLPLIRERVRRDLEEPGMGRNKVLAALVGIMEQTMIRVGNEEYAEKNDSYGLTTIRNQHAQVRGPKIRFRFKGKSGKLHDVEIKDRRLARIIRKCQELPGQELFGYLDENGRSVDITSSDVNDYLQETAGEAITAKDFRTWGGTVQAALALREIGPHRNRADLRKRILRAVERTAERLRNTPTVCRKYYIHPCVFEAYENGVLFEMDVRRSKIDRVSAKGLFPEEVFALRILQKSLML